MTKNDVFNMTPGPELDAWVTRLVMGQGTCHVWLHKPHKAALFAKLEAGGG
jgi:hypothetical protein